MFEQIIIKLFLSIGLPKLESIGSNIVFGFLNLTGFCQFDRLQKFLETTIGCSKFTLIEKFSPLIKKYVLMGLDKGLLTRNKPDKQTHQQT